MPKPALENGKKNVVGTNLKVLRFRHGLSQRDLSRMLQLAGYDMDRNAIIRIETYKRYVTDIEVKLLCEIFKITYEEFLDGEIGE